MSFLRRREARAPVVCVPGKAKALVERRPVFPRAGGVQTQRMPPRRPR